MALVTISVLEGLERGHVYEDLQTPITIGREDDNHIRLNDERVSRFHAKIQEDGGRIILTDLESTNGTRVNGHPMQLKVLAVGDLISIGRCLLLFGDREELAKQSRSAADSLLAGSKQDDHTVAACNSDLDVALQAGEGDAFGARAHIADDYHELFPAGVPEPPARLSPVQRAQVSDLLAFAHDRIRAAIEAGMEETDDEERRFMRIEWPAWQKMIALELELAQTLRRIADPDDA